MPWLTECPLLKERCLPTAGICYQRFDSIVNEIILRTALCSWQNQQAVFTQAMEDTPTAEQPFNIHLSCPSLTVVLRLVQLLHVKSGLRLNPYFHSG